MAIDAKATMSEEEVLILIVGKVGVMVANDVVDERMCCGCFLNDWMVGRLYTSRLSPSKHSCSSSLSEGKMSGF